ncbi:MAG: hypothetical protein JNK63_10365 [Chthonomonas sp.]|nr:hypothetical protein [Chthonomonas sp.]
MAPIKGFFLLHVLALAAVLRAADTTVVPSAFETTVGTGGFNGPTDGLARTYQWLIHADQLTPFVGRTLNGISFRQAGTSTTAYPSAEVTVPSFDLRIGPGVAPSARSITNFTLNHGSLTLVRSGQLIIPANSYPAGGIAFGPIVPFSTTYLYLGGHLLIEMRKSAHTGTSASSGAIVASGGATLGYGSQFSACWGTSSTSTAGSQGNFIITRLHAEPLPTIPVTGTIAFSDYIATLAGKSVQMVMKPVGSTTTIQSSSVTLNAAGEFTFSVLQSTPAGTYELYADTSPFIRRKQTLTLTAVGAANINFNLPNGDCDNSGEVDAADVDAIVVAFGAVVGNPNYSVSVDADGSSEVDAADIDIVIQGFGLVDD